MAGHSKWANIKHKKAAVDAKRGKLFTKLIKEITVAARLGGGDINSNSRLRAVIEKAKAANMPKDKIETAIKRGTGELEGVNYEDATYEGYGPAGVALLIKAVTDNKNRTTAELRHLLSKHGGNLGEPGCVAWIFEKKGQIIIENGGKGEEELLEITLDAGADDFQYDEENSIVFTSPEDLEEVKNNLIQSGIEVKSAEIVMEPKNRIKVTGEDAEKLLKLLEILEDHDDVQNVYANFDIDEKELENLVK